ncbi:hypothetical protein Tco_1550277, partial [Tanacetum coccineum]
SWGSSALWKMFNRYGNVVDVYIAFKRTKMGSREEASQSLKENKTWLDQWFDDLNLWGDNDGSCGRLTWIIIEGLPVIARNIGAVKAITNKFGRLDG